jgi:chemotaxis family two-component system sensor kinase Cph1
MVELFQRLIGGFINVSTGQPPRIHLSARRLDEEWIFTVRDCGLGTDLEQEERSFADFATQEVPGNGMSLAICGKIATRHGGRLWAESEPEQGLCIHVAIPAGLGESVVPPVHVYSGRVK